MTNTKERPDNEICLKAGCDQLKVEDSRYCWEHSNIGLDDPNCCEECGADVSKDGYCWECDF